MELINDKNQNGSTIALTSDVDSTSRFRRILKSITIEPMIFLLSISLTISYLYVSSLTMYKICRVTFDYNETICKNLSSHKELETNVQKVSSNYSMYATLIETIPSLIFVAFFGSWTDKYGRKIPLIFGLITNLIPIIILITAAEINQFPPLLLLLSPLIVGLLGGAKTLEITLYSYVTDITDNKSRTIKMAILAGVWTFGAPLATLLSGFLLKTGGYSCVLGVGGGLFTLSIIYTIFFVKESLKNETKKTQTNSKGWFMNFINIQNVKEGFSTFFKKRPHNKHYLLWLLELCKLILSIPASGTGSISYMYLRLKPGWNDIIYSYYTATHLGIICLGSLLVVPFLVKVLHVKDPHLSILGIFFNIMSIVVITESTEIWMLFAGSVLLLFAECVTSPIYSLITQCVEADEVGKLFSVISLIECAIPIVSSTIYTQIYNATLHTLPETVFYVSCVFYIVVLVIMTYISFNFKTTKENVNQSTD